MEYATPKRSQDSSRNLKEKEKERRNVRAVAIKQL
jgi:hypothetical protein